MDEIMISMENAAVSFKKFKMQPVNLEIPKGYIVGVQGENGAGKSTLLNMLAGVYTNMTGSVRIKGLDVVNDRENALQNIGFIEENRTYFESENASKNGEMYSDFFINWDFSEYQKMLNKLKLSTVKKIGAFSKGERIKYQLAFSAAYQPDVLLLDEPTAGLDPIFRDDFLRILQEFVAEYETTILLATHLDEDLHKIADYIIDVSGGVCSMREARHE